MGLKELCRHKDMDTTGPKLHSLSGEQEASSGESRARILVCEDEVFIALSEVDLLERHGYEVVGTADTCDRAIEDCERLCPDLVLLDITLRGEGDGVEAAAEIRRRFQIPFIFVTAHRNDISARRALAVQPAGYVPKPYDEGELLAAVDRALAA